MFFFLNSDVLNKTGIKILKIYLNEDWYRKEIIDIGAMETTNETIITGRKLLKIKRANMEVLKQVEEMFTIFQTFLLE